MASTPDTDFLTDKSKPSNNNYLAVNYFRLMIGRAPTTSYFAQDVSIPGISNQELIQPTRLSTQIPIPGNLYTFSPLSVKFIIDEGMRSWKEIYDWIISISNYTDISTIKHEDKISDINLIITNSAYKQKFKYTFRNAFPVSLSEVPLSITATDTLPLTATVAFKYTFYEFKSLT